MDNEKLTKRELLALSFATGAVANPKSVEDDMSALINKSFKMADEFIRQSNENAKQLE